NRVTANSMEPRGCLAQYDLDEERYTIRCTVQSVHQIRAALAGQIFRVPHHQVRVVCDTMGGGFGMKVGCYPEYGLALWASEVTAVLTNTMGTAPYRGGSRPEPIYVTESIIDKAASTPPSCAAATRSPPARCPTRRRCGRPMTAAISQRTSTTRSLSPITPAS